MGESICLKGSDGLRVATCAMVLNNTSWKFSNAPCPLTLRNTDDRFPYSSKTTPVDAPGLTVTAKPS